MSSYITNNVITSRPGDPTLFEQSKKDPDAFIVRLDRYRIEPLDAPSPQAPAPHPSLTDDVISAAVDADRQHRHDGVEERVRAILTAAGLTP